MNIEKGEISPEIKHARRMDAISELEKMNLEQMNKIIEECENELKERGEELEVAKVTEILEEKMEKIGCSEQDFRDVFDRKSTEEKDMERLRL